MKKGSWQKKHIWNISMQFECKSLIWIEFECKVFLCQQNLRDLEVLMWKKIPSNIEYVGTSVGTQWQNYDMNKVLLQCNTEETNKTYLNCHCDQCNVAVWWLFVGVVCLWWINWTENARKIKILNWKFTFCYYNFCFFF